MAALAFTTGWDALIQTNPIIRPAIDPSVLEQLDHNKVAMVGFFAPVTYLGKIFRQKGIIDESISVEADAFFIALPARGTATFPGCYPELRVAFDDTLKGVKVDVADLNKLVREAIAEKVEVEPLNLTRSLDFVRTPAQFPWFSTAQNIKQTLRDGAKRVDHWPILEQRRSDRKEEHTTVYIADSAYDPKNQDDYKSYIDSMIGDMQSATIYKYNAVGQALDGKKKDPNYKKPGWRRWLFQIELSNDVEVIDVNGLLSPHWTLEARGGKNDLASARSLFNFALWTTWSCFPHHSEVIISDNVTYEDISAKDETFRKLPGVAYTVKVIQVRARRIVVGDV